MPSLVIRIPPAPAFDNAYDIYVVSILYKTDKSMELYFLAIE